MAQESTPKTRLETWKEVAAFFRRDERTVKRWEASRGLPIHRLPGAGRSRIYADVEELEAWRRGDAAGFRALAAKLLALSRRPIPGWMLAASAGVLVLLAIGAPLAWRMTRPAQGRPSLAAERLYVQGMEDWRRRTPEALNRAVSEFEAAIARDPRYAAPYAGLAQCYDLLREYTLMPGSQAFPLARAAAQRALALNPSLADAHAALAFADYYGFWDADRARREFDRAIALDPNSETAHHWYATFLMERGDNVGALREIDRALALNPAAEAIQADRWDLLYHAGRQADATAGLRAMEASDPGFLSPHNYLAGFALRAGRDDEFLKEAAWAAQLTGDRNRSAQVQAAAEGLAASGHPGLLRGLLAEQLQQYQQGSASAYSVAQTYALLGQDAPATSFLKVSLRRHEPEVTYIAADQIFAGLRSTPAFRSLLAELKPL